MPAAQYQHQSQFVPQSSWRQLRDVVGPLIRQIQPAPTPTGPSTPGPAAPR